MGEGGGGDMRVHMCTCARPSTLLSKDTILKVWSFKHKQVNNCPSSCAETQGVKKYDETVESMQRNLHLYTEKLHHLSCYVMDCAWTPPNGNMFS